MDLPEYPDYAERNREAWNEVAPIHRQHWKSDLRQAVQSESFSTLSDIERAVFAKLSAQGKTVAQLCCNNGRELISVLKLGAESGTGFDISDEMIKEATLLGSLSHTRCEFVRTHIYDIGETYSGRFDIAYITIGSLGWFHDLDRFFAVVNHILRPGGHLFIYEMHPVLDMLALPGEDAYDPEHELRIAYSYFKSDPFVETNGLDYVGNTQYAAKPAYSFPHTISAVLTALLNSGLALREFTEYGHDISNSFAFLEKYHMLPMCYTLLAQK